MSVTKSTEDAQPVASRDTLPDPLFRLLSEAIRESASDVHVDSWGHEAAVRFRCRPIQPHERRLFDQATVTAPDEVFDAVGCHECFGRGYRGRTGVFQVVSIDDEFGNWLADGRRQAEIRERLEAAGSRSIVADALEKVAAGVTSMGVPASTCHVRASGSHGTLFA